MFINGRLRFLIIISTILLIFVLSWQICACKLSPVKRVEETRDYMGTYVTIVVYSDEETARKAISSAFNRIGEIEKIASIFDENSEAYKLNENGYLDNPSSELVELITTSLQYYKLTGGSFDITIQPILELWQEGLWKEEEEVQAEKIKEALKVVGSDKIEVSKNRIEFTVEGMAITLGGIAKGYAIDEALEVIQDMGIESALINAGGDMRALGSKPGKEMWSIALENPDNTSEKIVSFRFSDKAVATSGNYERYFNPDKSIHHIIDPKTGFSADSCISATVIADSSTEADVLATSVFVMGPQDGKELIESLEGIETLIIDSEREIYKSSGLSDYLK